MNRIANVKVQYVVVGGYPRPYSADFLPDNPPSQGMVVERVSAGCDPAVSVEDVMIQISYPGNLVRFEGWAVFHAPRLSKGLWLPPGEIPMVTAFSERDDIKTVLVNLIGFLRPE